MTGKETASKQKIGTILIRADNDPIVKLGLDKWWYVDDLENFGTGNGDFSTFSDEGISRLISENEGPWSFA